MPKTGYPVNMDRGIWAGSYKDHAVLILQCAGKITAEGAVAEDTAEGGYLTGSGCNACIVRDFYMRRGASPCVYSEDFSTNKGELEPEDVIKDFLEENRHCVNRIIYYCGHGCRPNGEWAIHLVGKNEDRYISYTDMETWLDEAGGGRLEVISQSCHSGNWCYTTKFTVYASAKPEECSKCSPDGSYWTRYLFGKDRSCNWNYWQLGSQPVKNWT